MKCRWVLLTTCTLMIKWQSSSSIVGLRIRYSLDNKTNPINGFLIFLSRFLLLVASLVIGWLLLNCNCKSEKRAKIYVHFGFPPGHLTSKVYQFTYQKKQWKTLFLTTFQFSTLKMKNKKLVAIRWNNLLFYPIHYDWIYFLSFRTHSSCTLLIKTNIVFKKIV